MLGPNDTVLVTGATGFTGRTLVRKLCELGCNVKAIARESSNRSELADLEIDWTIGDVYDPVTVKEAAADANYIFHVAAAFREAKIEDDIYYRVHVESTQLLAKAALSNRDFKRFLHVSTVGVLGHIEKPPADESSPYNPGDVYQETKATAEKWVLDFAQKNDLPLTVVRPAAIYGPGDRRLLKIFKFAKLPIIPIIGFTKGLYHLIHVDDLVGFMILAAQDSSAIGQIYICGNDAAISITDMLRLLAKQLGRKPIFIRLPAWPFFLLGYLCELIFIPLNLEPPIYRRRVAFFTKDRSFNTAKMRKIKDFEYSKGMEAGLLDTLDWYQANGWMSSASSESARAVTN